MKQKGFVPILLLVGILVMVAVAGGAYYLGKFPVLLPFIHSPISAVKSVTSYDECVKAGYPVLESYPSKCRTPEGRFFTQPLPGTKTYTNTTYGFKITYPARGVVHGTDNYFEGECGQAIKEQKNGSETVIDFDNLFKMTVLPWKGSIDDYLASVWAKNKYELEKLATASAKLDEAIAFKGLKKGVEYAVGYPPLVYTSYIFKKGNFLYVVKNDPTHLNPGGCVNPNMIDPVKYAKYREQGWDFAQNFKFN